MAIFKGKLFVYNYLLLSPPTRSCLTDLEPKPDCHWHPPADVNIRCR